MNDIQKESLNYVSAKSKATDIVTYRIARGLECLIGYPYIKNNIERINEIINFILK